MRKVWSLAEKKEHLSVDLKVTKMAEMMVLKLVAEKAESKAA